MCVCIYVCMSVCMYVCMCVYMYVCTCVCMQVCKNGRTYVRTNAEVLSEMRITLVYIEKSVLKAKFNSEGLNTPGSIWKYNIY